MLGDIMSLDRTLADVTNRLRQDEFPNEQAISQGIVLRLLQVLGWDTWNTNVVWPEYQTGGGRADFALCHPPSKPAVFIEVKHVGKAEGAVRQALQYAFECGVPFVVLTDGRTWSFYLPAEQGDYEDRRVYKIDLYERSSSEAAETFTRYLSHSNVESGRSLEDARTEYRNLNRRSQAKAAIPVVWRELVEKRDESLIDIVVDAVESKVGFQPDADDVARFLGSPALSGRPAANSRGGATRTARRRRAEPEDKSRERARPDGSGSLPDALASKQPAASARLLLRGRSYDCSTAKEAMVVVLRELANADPSFLERCARDPAAQGRKRRYIARTPEDLYPDREDLRELYAELPGGWLVGTNLSNQIKRRIMSLAAKIAGLQIGRDLVIPF